MIKKQKSIFSIIVSCEIAHKNDHSRIIKKFERCFVIADGFPVSLGHILIIPYEHTEHWFTASPEIQNDLVRALGEMKLYLDEKYKPDGYNMGINCGVAAGQSIMHLHMHLIPRYKGDMDNPKGGVRGVIPHKQKY